MDDTALLNWIIKSRCTIVNFEGQVWVQMKCDGYGHHASFPGQMTKDGMRSRFKDPRAAMKQEQKDARPQD